MVKSIAGRGKWQLILGRIFALSVMVVAGFYAQQANAALTSVPQSPNPAYFTEDGSSTSVPYYHIIKKADSSQVTSLQMAAYFDAVSPSYEIRIDDNQGGARCRYTGTVDPFIYITLSTNTSSAQNSVTYGIPRSKLCATPTAAQEHNAYGSTDSFLFGYFKVPAGFTSTQAVRDSNTQLYKVNINIRYNAAVPQMADSGDQQILFSVKLNGCGATCVQYLSTVPIGTSERNFSTAGSRDKIGNGYARQRFGFGLPCSVDGSDPTRTQGRTINIYDIDNGHPWDPDSNTVRRIKFYVEKQVGGVWTKVAYKNTGSAASREITGVTNVNGPSNGQTEFTQDDGSGTTTKITINLKPRTKYRISFEPTWHTNLLGVGLPEETIFGDLDCNVGLNGSITTNPTTGITPIEVGRKISFTARGNRTGNTDFDSVYTSKLLVWYDTGNEAVGSERFSAGEEKATGPGCDNTLNVRQTGAGFKDIGACSDVLSDATKSGGKATAICAQLILTRQPEDVITQIGTGNAPNGLVQCYQIGKRPHLSALNGDVLSGGSTATPCTLTQAPIISGNKVSIDGVNYGSYSTYGVTSLGISQDFGSNGLKPGDATSAALVFSNRTESGVNGFFYSNNNSTTVPSTGRCLTDPFTTLGAKATTSGGAPASVDLSSLATPGATTARYYTGGGTINVTASAAIPPSAKVIIYARNANVKINSSIRYAEGPYASVTLLPQVVVLTNKDLTVDDQVEQMDGIYAAKGNVTTCDVAPRLTTCNKALAVNGSVVAGKILRPYRTFGADRPDYGQTAETFSLRPDTLIGQLPGPNDPSVYVRTVSEREIPPRF